MRRFAAVALREVAERRSVLVAAAAAAVLPFLVPLLPGVPSDQGETARSLTALVLASALGLGGSILVGASVVGRELAERRLSFHFARPLSAPVVWGGKLVGGLALVLLAELVVYLPSSLASGRFPGLIDRFDAPAMAALLLGYKAPDLFVDNKRQKRTDAIRKGLPDALDLLVICAEAGLTVDAAFSRVAKELGRAYPELGEEFALTSIELGFLTERRQAFENLAYRVNLESVKGVVTTMIQTEKYGTPLASALRVLSAEFRNERMMRAEEKAARLPAIMTIPLILFILPVLFVVILGPAACSLSDAMSGGGFGKSWRDNVSIGSRRGRKQFRPLF